jgi:hypothetical protein
MPDASAEDVDVDVATGVGLVLLDDVPVAAAADVADVTRWELEDAIERADLAERVGLADGHDLAEEIDSVLERED